MVPELCVRRLSYYQGQVVGSHQMFGVDAPGPCEVSDGVFQRLSRDHPGVEDDVPVRLAVADYRRGCGYQMFEADSAADAKTVLDGDARVDLVFSGPNLRGKENGLVRASWIVRVVSE